ncbi:MAG: hypothetical protein Q4C04_01155 [Clostridia bacterium]|nr:hypothetical protein [Clostridia bacterium]
MRTALLFSLIVLFAFCTGCDTSSRENTARNEFISLLSEKGWADVSVYILSESENPIISLSCADCEALEFADFCTAAYESYLTIAVSHKLTELDLRCHMASRECSWTVSFDEASGTYKVLDGEYYFDYTIDDIRAMYEDDAGEVASTLSSIENRICDEMRDYYGWDVMSVDVRNSSDGESFIVNILFDSGDPAVFTSICDDALEASFSACEEFGRPCSLLMILMQGDDSIGLEETAWLTTNGISGVFSYNGADYDDVTIEEMGEMLSQ